MSSRVEAVVLVAPFLVMAFAMIYMTLRYRNLSHKYAALKQNRTLLRTTLRETRDRIMSWPIDDTETCMCGSAVKAHGIGDGHSPVSVSDHALVTIRDEIDKVLA